QEAIPNMKFVICIRNPLEVARSLEKRNRTPLKKGASLWYRYMRASIEDTEDCPRLFTFFDDYFDNGAKEVERLMRFCDLPVPPNRQLAQGAVSSDLRHHSSADRSLLDEAMVSVECKNFYLGLRALLPSNLPYDETRGAQDSLKVGVFVKSFQDQQSANLELHSSTSTQEKVSGVGRATRKIKKLLVSLKRS
ncbi:MAG TPA: hypothetical protein VHV54_11980, partial [Candidatus Binatia bacterium]|nr:hypothetical protein [Candidatus Binatia bacterium]